jgi:putative phage-type endonuclease
VSERRHINSIAVINFTRRRPDTMSEVSTQEAIALPEILSGRPVESELPKDDALEAFLEERKTMLGGTDLAAILGFSPWKTAWDVAAEKKGIIPPTEASERMQWGTLLEDPIAKEYARRTGQRIRRVNEAMRHRTLPFLGGHPDRLVVGRRKGVEVKTVDRGAREWSEPGMPMKVPKAYYVQVQHYLAVTGYEEWDLVPLFGLRAMRIYTIEPNDRVMRSLLERGQDFWERYCIGPDLPPIEPSEAAKAYLREQYPTHDNTLLIANEQLAETIAKWREAKSKREAYEKEEEKFKISIQAAIGSASGVRSGGLVVTWRKDRDSIAEITDWEAIVRDLNVPIAADLIIKHTRTEVTRQGARKLLVKEVK